MHAVPDRRNVIPFHRTTSPVQDAEKWLEDLLLIASIQRPFAMTLKKEPGDSSFIIQVYVSPLPSVGTEYIRPLSVEAATGLGEALAKRLDVRKPILLLDRPDTNHGSFRHSVGETILTVSVVYERQRRHTDHLTELRLEFHFARAA